MMTWKEGVLDYVMMMTMLMNNDVVLPMTTHLSLHLTCRVCQIVYSNPLFQEKRRKSQLLRTAANNAYIPSLPSTMDIDTGLSSDLNLRVCTVLLPHPSFVTILSTPTSDTFIFAFVDHLLF